MPDILAQGGQKDFTHGKMQVECMVKCEVVHAFDERENASSNASVECLV